MDDLKIFLTEKVLLFESDTLPAATEKVLQQISREKTEVPVIMFPQNTGSIIAGSEKTYNAIKSYISENQPYPLS